MKKHLVSNFFLFLYTLLATINVCELKAASLDKDVSIKPLSALKDFPSNSVLRILQDREGYLWFGTSDGLCRYDAYQVMTFRSDVTNPNLLCSNEITCLSEDYDNNIWIGTKKGISILDKKTYKITKLTDGWVDNVNIKDLQTASDSSTWIAADNRVVRFDHKTKKLTQLVTGDEHLPATGINSIYEDNFGDIWISFWHTGLYRYKKNGELVKYPPIGQKHNNPFSIFQDKDNQYWIGTWGDGFYRFYPSKDEANMYQKVNIKSKDNINTEDTFFSITQDGHKNYLWLVGFSGLYVVKYDDDDNVSQVNISSLFKNTNNIFSEVIKDRDGDIWIASFSEGAFNIGFDKTRVSEVKLDYISDNLGLTPNVTAIHEDVQGNLWFNQNRFGLCVYDAKTKLINSYKDYSVLKNDQGLKHVSSFLSTRGDDHIWLGMYDEPRISIIKKEGGRVNHIDEINLSLIYPNAGGIRLLFEDSKRNKWIVTSTETYILNNLTQSLEVVDDELTSISSITEDRDGNIWLSREYGGLYKVEYAMDKDSIKYEVKSTQKVKDQILTENHISTICADYNHKIWIGTIEGAMFSYDQINNVVEDHTYSILLKNEAIQNIVEDKFGTIWISTNKRVIEYNPTTKTSTDYTSNDGVCVDSFLKDSYHYNVSKNMLYYGGNKGINTFSSSSVSTLASPSTKVVISDVKTQSSSILNKNHQYGKEKLSDAIQINSDDRNIEIIFSSLNYTYPDKILYSYKMKGVDEDWVVTDRQFAIYNQLDKGLNTLYVRATDRNKMWSDEITTFHIYKKPAFYETWWAYCIYLALFTVLLYTIIKIAKHRFDLRNKLEIANIEKQKSEELTQTKLSYFTNITHDFLTPLTIISCLTDEMEASTRRKVPQFDTIRYNITRLKRLLQQILDFRKIENHNIQLKVGRNDLTRFVKSILLDNFGPLAVQKNISLKFTSEPKQIIAYFDLDKLDKILYNVVSNALKFTNKDGIVEVSVGKKVEGELEYAIITVEDTGIGISADKLDKIFTRFFVNDNSQSNSNGIGLSIAQDLVNIHKGEITVVSEVGKGTIFTIEIPISKEFFSHEELSTLNFEILDWDDSSEDILTLTEVEKEEELPDEAIVVSSDINILVVEDNEDILYFIKKTLQKKYNVFSATNGLIALNIIKDNDIDIVVSDIMMPEMDGLDLCRMLKADIETSHITVILLTAKNRTQDRIESYEAGADGYISKPFEMRVLEARITNFVTHKKARQEEFKIDREIKIETLKYPSLDEQFLNDAVNIIEEHISDSEFDIDAFSSSLNLSKSTLYRKLKTMTGLSPNEFIRNIRLKHACQLLSNPNITISEVAYTVGFTDPRYFATCFKNEFDMTPTNYQKQNG